MALTIEQQKAKALYAQGKSAAYISKELNIGKSTIYRWINDEGMGFKESREMANFSAGDIEGIIDESHKKLLMQIAEDPDSLLNPKTADALLKVSKVLEALSLKKEKEKMEAEALKEEVRGVLIIDDIQYRNLKKKKDKIIEDDKPELS